MDLCEISLRRPAPFVEIRVIMGWHRGIVQKRSGSKGNNENVFVISVWVWLGGKCFRLCHLVSLNSAKGVYTAV